MTDAGSEFQTEGAAYRKERFAKSLVAASERLDEQWRSRRA